MSGYSIDANVIIDLNRDMPEDVHVGIWAEFRQLVAEGRARMSREAAEELKGVDDGCYAIAKGMSGFVVDGTQEEINLAAEISNRFPKWVQKKRNAADPFVIAHAKVHNLTVVTGERVNGPGWEEQNLKIPTVATLYDVTCVNIVGLSRDEGWTFSSA